MKTHFKIYRNPFRPGERYNNAIKKANIGYNSHGQKQRGAEKAASPLPKVTKQFKL